MECFEMNNIYTIIIIIIKLEKKIGLNFLFYLNIF